MDTIDLIILGTGGTCNDIVDIVADINGSQSDVTYRCVGFLDDDERKWGCTLYGIEVLGPIDSAPDHSASHFVNGVGSPSSFDRRAGILSHAGVASDRFASLIHPSAFVSPTATIGAGSVLFPHACITSNAHVGRHALVLSNTVVGHDARVGDHTCVAGGVYLAGRVQVGASSYIGANASVREDVCIGDRCLVGMGAVVCENVAANSVVVGNPATFLRPVSPHD